MRNNNGNNNNNNNKNGNSGSKGYNGSNQRYYKNKRKKNFTTFETRSFAYGIGVGVLAMVLFPQLKEGLKPIAAGAIKGVSGLAEKLQETITDVKEGFEDVVAEAKFENLKKSLDKEILGDISSENVSQVTDQ